MAPVNGFGSISFMYIAMCVAGISYSGFQDGPGASYSCSAGVVGILHCIMAESCIRTLLGAFSLIITDKLSKKFTKKIKKKYFLCF